MNCKSCKIFLLTLSFFWISGFGLSAHSLVDWTKECFKQVNITRGGKCSSTQTSPKSISDLEQEYTKLNQNKPSNFIEKIIVPENCKICFIGDLHESNHALIRYLWRLVALGYIDNNFKITDPNFYMVLTGDFVTGGGYESEIKITLLNLKLSNWNNVFMIQGNMDGGWGLTNQFPSAVFVGCKYDDKNINWGQFCHAGPALSDAGNSDTIFENYCKTLKTFLSSNNNDSTCEIEQNADSRIKNFKALKDKSTLQAYAGNIIKDYLNQNNIKAVFRGHQHTKNTLGIGYAPDQGDQQPVPSWKDTHGLEDEIKINPNGFAISSVSKEIEPFFTLLSASDTKSDKSNSDGFIIITITKDSSEWRIKPYIFELDKNRDQKYNKLSKSQSPSLLDDPIKIEFVEKVNADPSISDELITQAQSNGLKHNLGQLGASLTTLKNRLIFLSQELLNLSKGH